MMRKAASFVERGCQIFAMMALCYLLLVVAGSIAARLFFDISDGSINFLIPGAIEQSRYALLLLVFACIPAYLRSSFVNVDFLANRFPRPLATLLSKLWLLLALIFASTLTFLFTSEAQKTFMRGDLTQDLLLPLYVFYGLVTLLCGAFAFLTIAALIAREPPVDPMISGAPR